MKRTVAAIALGGFSVLAAPAHAAPIGPEVVLEVKLTGSAAKVRSVAGRGELEPLVSGVDLGALAAKARARTGRSLPDMAAWQRLTLPAGTDADAAIKDLLASGQVSDAYVAPEAAPPPQTQPTPDFTSMQGYLRAGAAGHRRRLLPRATRAPGAPA